MNFSSMIAEQARLRPYHLAIVAPSLASGGQEVSLSYKEFIDLCHHYRAGLSKNGFSAQNRLVLLFPVSVELYVLVVACMMNGVVPVFIDTGMSRTNILRAISQSRSRAVIASADFIRYWPLMSALWFKRKYTVDEVVLFSNHISALFCEPLIASVLHPCAPNDTALVTFTSGTTGAPKGADRTHEVLIAQHQALARNFPHQDKDIDLPTFPMLVLHNLCCGISSIIPELSFSTISEHEPALIARQIERHGVTRISGAPAFLNRLLDYALQAQPGLSSVRQIGVGGAPASKIFCESLINSFPRAEIKIIYGSTEAEPISTIAAADILSAEGKGFLVGSVVEECLINFLPVSQELNHGDIQQIVVSGSHVVNSYLDEHPDNKINKIIINGKVWHKTGDTGYLDEQKRLWITGRVTDVINFGDKMIAPFVVESELLAHKDIELAALITTQKKMGLQLFVQINERAHRSTITMFCNEVLKKNGLLSVPVTFNQKMPVDGRHNSKIDRNKLRALIDVN